MAKGPTIPEGPAFTAAWRSLDKQGRRRIRRAVNRAQPAANRTEAALAVAVARGQRRFWRWGWVLGPLLAMALLFTEDVEVVIANGLFAVVLFGALAWFFTRRARRAEAINLERAGASSKPRKAQGAEDAARAEPPKDTGTTRKRGGSANRTKGGHKHGRKRQR